MIILDQNLMDSDMLSNRDTEPNSQGVNQHQTKTNAPQNIFVYFYSDGAIGSLAEIFIFELNLLR